ncbi:MAG TPA: fumarylacetoacetate hydrolase family protein, partial [Burkholderiales bacterium]|nr:fumarylacetoacetate hydrolase family protein [Burkholderiales bacterium]
ALDHVFGYGVGLDMTRRDLQSEAKKLQRPWEMGKSFDQSCPVTPLQPAAKVGHPAKGAIWLKVNGEVKQKGDLNQQIWRVEETIAYLSQFVALEPGDLILNGTPAGVGPCQAGDRLEGHVDGVGDLVITYAAEGAARKAA